MCSMNGSASAPSFGDHEWHALAHQPGDEVHVAREPVELGHDNRPLQPAGPCQRRGELRPALQRVRALAGFDLDEFGVDLVALAATEAGDGLALSLDAQA